MCQNTALYALQTARSSVKFPPSYVFVTFTLTVLSQQIMTCDTNSFTWHDCRCWLGIWHQRPVYLNNEIQYSAWISEHNYILELVATRLPSLSARCTPCVTTGREMVALFLSVAEKATQGWAGWREGKHCSLQGSHTPWGTKLQTTSSLVGLSDWFFLKSVFWNFFFFLLTFF